MFIWRPLIFLTFWTTPFVILGMGLLERGLKSLEKRGRVSKAARESALSAERLTTTTDFGALSACDVVIEAVFEV